MNRKIDVASRYWPGPKTPRSRTCPRTPTLQPTFQEVDHAFLPRNEEPHLHEHARQHASRAGTSESSHAATVGAGGGGAGGSGEVLQPRGLQPPRHDRVVRVLHRGLRHARRPRRLRSGGARAAAGEALGPPLRRQLGGLGGGIARILRRRGIRRRRIPDLRGSGMRAAPDSKGRIGNENLLAKKKKRPALPAFSAFLFPLSLSLALEGLMREKV
jgi:hypothetical protein